MLTPIDIHNKEFSTRFKGFDPEEVNDYLDEIIRAMEQLIRDNKDLEKRVKFNEEKVAYFNSVQETLNKSIIVAQEAADRLKENARKDAEIIIYEAEKTAAAMLKEAADQATEINRETDELKKETRIFRQRLQIMVESQLEMIKNEEWDSLLKSRSKLEVVPPTVDALIQKRAKKNDQLLGETVEFHNTPLPTLEERVEAEPKIDIPMDDLHRDFAQSSVVPKEDLTETKVHVVLPDDDVVVLGNE